MVTNMDEKCKNNAWPGWIAGLVLFCFLVPYIALPVLLIASLTLPFWIVPFFIWLFRQPKDEVLIAIIVMIVSGIIMFRGIR